MRREKRRQVSSDGGVGGIRQAEFLKARSPRDGLFLELNERKEAVNQKPLNFVSREFHLDRSADQSRAGRRQAERQLLRRTIAEQRFLDLPRPLHQHRPLPRLELAVADQLSLDMMRQRQIEVVAAENEMLTHRHAMKLCLALTIDGDVDEREIGRAAADVADQNLLPWSNQLLPILSMGVDPLINGGLRLFDEHNARQSCDRCGLDRQLASDLVERGGQREDNLLLFQRLAPKAMVPGGSDVGQVSAANGDWRKPLDVRRTVPRQQVGQPIHS